MVRLKGDTMRAKLAQILAKTEERNTKNESNPKQSD